MPTKISRNTIQRDLVLNAVRNLYHPTADEVYSEISKQSPSISRATVYRNLHLLVDTNYIAQVCIPGEADHFDGIVEHHHHAKCSTCGKIIDIKAVKAVEKLSALFIDEVEHESGFTIENYDFHLSGTCADCKRKAIF